MALYKTKPWPPAELGFFKAGCLAIGMILGSYLSGFVQQYLWGFIAVAALTAARVCSFYLLAEVKSGNEEALRVVPGWPDRARPLQ